MVRGGWWVVALKGEAARVGAITEVVMVAGLTEVVTLAEAMEEGVQEAMEERVAYAARTPSSTQRSLLALVSSY